MLNAVLDVPEIERGVEMREKAAAQIANELSAEQIEAKRARERLVVLELGGKRLAGALERTVRGDAGDAGVEDVHEGKDLGRELRDDLAEITPVLRGERTGRGTYGMYYGIELLRHGREEFDFQHVGNWRPERL